MFRLIAVTVIPLLFFLVLEAALRIGGFGYSTSYFVKSRINGRDAARRAGANVIVCTLGVNLKDCAPFASMHSPALSSSDGERWSEFYAQGTAAESAGRFADATKAYEAAAALDDSFAELHFRLRRCYAALQAYDQAAQQYALARNLDTLPFRANR